MLQFIVAARYGDYKHTDGAASLLNMGFGFFGEFILRIWDKDADTPPELHEKLGSVCIGSPSVFWHQVVHRDDEGSCGGQAQAGLFPIEGLGLCKVAFQFRCDLFGSPQEHPHARKTMPLLGRELVKTVVQPWLQNARLELPSLEDCRSLLPDACGTPACTPASLEDPPVGAACPQESPGALRKCDTVRVLVGERYGEEVLVTDVLVTDGAGEDGAPEARRLYQVAFDESRWYVRAGLDFLW